MKPHLLLIAISMCICGTLAAQIIHVPDDQPTIQAGINAASDGDTVLVEEGTYVENINFIGKAITVTSWFIIDSDPDHIEYTVIDGSQPVDPDKAAVVTFESGEDTTSVICGFTITGGSGNYIPWVPVVGGGGIACNNAGASILNNHIEYNDIVSDYYGEGAGIGAGPSDTDLYLLIRNNRISHNTLWAYNIGSGGGISIHTDALIMGNEISDNLIESFSQYVNGGGIYSGGGDTYNTVSITGNVISGNEVKATSNINYHCSGGGVFIYKNQGEISHNVIAGNGLDGSTIGRGAGVCIAICDTSLNIYGNWIHDNYFEGLECWGGGINLWGAGPKLVNNLVAYNTSSMGGGIFSYDEHTQSILLVNNTITENEAEEIGGGLYLWGSNAIIMNTILWNDFANFSYEIAIIDSQLEVLYSDVDGGWPGESNFNADPEFADDTLFHISWADSPCWDAGIDQIEIGGIVYYAPDQDLEGEARPGDAGVDIGADEDAMWEGVDGLQVASYGLQVFPNPCFGRSEIKYQIAKLVPTNSREIKSVLIQVNDIHGAVVCTVVNEKQCSGEHSVFFDTSGLPAGIYLIRLQAGDAVATQKIVVVSH